MQIDNYAKVDFHIHSYASKTKEGDVEKTKENIFENIDVLFTRMNNSKVNMFSFTDHNTFDFSLYSKTINLIGSNNNKYTHIKKILPGVEFDLDFDDEDKRVHAICIFNDDDMEKLSVIDDIIKYKVGERKYNEVKFSEEELNYILQKIQLDFVLIVHQKSDILNDKIHGDNDFSNLKEKVKERLIYCDYFTLYESNQHLFRFRFEELKKRMSYSSNFVTGSDCHTWKDYPDLTEPGCNFDFTYIKTDFSFVGLKIAVTGNGERRILKNLPISNEIICESIKYSINGENKEIPLSNGINAIIGGNTSGKSLMLARVFGELDPNKNGADFLKKWRLSFDIPKIEENRIEYTKQGDVRRIFEEDGSGLVSKFRELFFSIDYTEFFNKIDIYSSAILERAKRNSRFKELLKKLDCIISIPNYDDVTYYPLVTPLPVKPKNPTKNIVIRFERVIQTLEELFELVDQDDKSDLRAVKDLLLASREKYDARNDYELMMLDVYNAFISAKNDYLKYIQEKSITVTEIELMQYDKVVSDYLDDLSEMIELKLNDKTDINSILEVFIIEPISNEQGDLCYITSPKESQYSIAVIEKILMSAFKQNSQFNFREDVNGLDIDYFIEYLKRNSSERIDKLNYYQKYKTLIEVELRKNYFFDTFKVLDKDEPIHETKSPGNNAIYYIKTKSEMMNNKLVIFDQPEDDVAPEKIRTDLIKSLSKMAVSNQVIIVTHNPQLVVNLDVDNVICMDDSKDDFKIHHGPLYQKTESNILKIIAEKLDGGKNALKERWRRYE